MSCFSFVTGRRPHTISISVEVIWTPQNIRLVAEKHQFVHLSKWSCITPVKWVYVFGRVCLNVCLSACLSAGLLTKWWTDLHETFTTFVPQAKKQFVYFWRWSGLRSGSRVRITIRIKIFYIFTSCQGTIHYFFGKFRITIRIRIRIQYTITAADICSLWLIV